MLYFIEWLRTFAVLLITNSHFDGVYPVNIATGGELGTALFFMITGYLMANADSTVPFKSWYGKRILRLYIPVLLITPFEILLGRVVITSIWDVIRRFVWPTTYWFVGAMAIHYAVFYLFVRNFRAQAKNKSKIAFGFGAGIVLLFMAGYWVIDKTKFSLLTDTVAAQAVWLLCMSIGMLLRNRKTRQGRSHTAAYLLLCVLCTACYMGAKVLIGRGWLLGLQCIPILASAGFAAFLFMVFMDSEHTFRRLSENRIIRSLIQLISKNSLEIYMVQ